MTSVICLYSKSGGQHGKHGAVVNSPSITALSYIGVQVFGHSHSRWFTYIPQKTSQLQTKQFALLPPKRLLLCLGSPANVNETQVTEVSQDDHLEFKSLLGAVALIKKALDKYEE